MSYVVNICGLSIKIDFADGRPSIVEEIEDYRSSDQLIENINKVLIKLGLESDGHK